VRTRSWTLVLLVGIAGCHVQPEFTGGYRLNDGATAFFWSDGTTLVLTPDEVEKAKARVLHQGIDRRQDLRPQKDQVERFIEDIAKSELQLSEQRPPDNAKRHLTAQSPRNSRQEGPNPPAEQHGQKAEEQRAGLQRVVTSPMRQSLGPPGAVSQGVVLQPQQIIIPSVVPHPTYHASDRVTGANFSVPGSTPHVTIPPVPLAGPPVTGEQAALMQFRNTLASWGLSGLVLNIRRTRAGPQITVKGEISAREFISKYRYQAAGDPDCLAEGVVLLQQTGPNDVFHVSWDQSPDPSRIILRVELLSGAGRRDPWRHHKVEHVSHMVGHLIAVFKRRIPTL
jgi:hypothetical protein